MNLKHLTDASLLRDIKKLTQKEREITTEILHHLKEIDRRKLYSDLKYSTLFEYCIKELGLPESCAHRKIEASRLLNDIPEIEQKIEEGTLNITNLAKAAQFIKEANILDTGIKKDIIKKIENLTTRECDRKLNAMRGSEDRRVRISIQEKTHNELFKIRGFIGSKMTLDEVIMLMIGEMKAKVEKNKFKQNSKVSSLPAQEAGRVISAYVKKEVYKRDKQCVQCGSTQYLNYDHRVPYSLGGKSNMENVRLLCFNCNQRSRIKAKL